MKFRPFLLILLLGTSCGTLRYREIQERFEAAVRADHDRLVAPFVDPATAYAAVAQELTPERIGRLPEALRPNAWTLRAIASWRSGSLAEALAGAEAGRVEIGRQSALDPRLEESRDAVVLALVPALVEDSGLRERWRAGGAGDVAARYEDYAAGFTAALRQLADAARTAGPATPEDVRHYLSYQSWRILENWQFILGQLPWAEQAEANRRADRLVGTVLAGIGLRDVASLPAALRSAEEALPLGHPYRRLIELERR